MKAGYAMSREPFEIMIESFCACWFVAAFACVI
jgi:hypothetical protein